MLKKVLLRGLLGFPIGVFISATISLIISAVIGNGNYYAVTLPLIDTMGSELNAVVLQYILSGLLGTACGIGSVIWDLERWSLAKQTILHFLLLVFTMIPVMYLCKWIGPSLLSIAIFVGVFIVVYIIIWLVSFKIFKYQVDAVNEKLQEK